MNVVPNSTECGDVAPGKLGLVDLPDSVIVAIASYVAADTTPLRDAPLPRIPSYTQRHHRIRRTAAGVGGRACCCVAMAPPRGGAQWNHTVDGEETGRGPAGQEDPRGRVGRTGKDQKSGGGHRTTVRVEEEDEGGIGPDVDEASVQEAA
ncbi:hypothetical protein Pelo_19385 [Pelomyxa schiedti]|nr:hypothetical protein Pelo_19385 [Pelomyxa schiedti]